MALAYIFFAMWTVLAIVCRQIFFFYLNSLYMLFGKLGNRNISQAFGLGLTMFSFVLGIMLVFSAVQLLQNHMKRLENTSSFSAQHKKQQMRVTVVDIIQTVLFFLAFGWLMTKELFEYLVDFLKNTFKLKPSNTFFPAFQANTGTEQEESKTNIESSSQETAPSLTNLKKCLGSRDGTAETAEHKSVMGIIQVVLYFLASGWLVTEEFFVYFAVCVFFILFF
ncbi:ATPase MORC2B [Labeo rohita]|uniref:ATPase MORC2B n=1 Tax=Labeo rohita TaxID=84645 RepID=A0ABQ8MEV9_LABRO|nr:ATPase MORC2B [Labeo rohita]